MKVEAVKVVMPKIVPEITIMKGGKRVNKVKINQD